MQFEQKYLDEFAYLGDKIYLDWCALGLQPQRTLNFCSSFQQEFADTLGRVCLGPYGERRAAVKRVLADMIGASPEEIQFAMNTTEGDCLLMHAYPLQPGDSVVVSDFDYPAVCYGWYGLQSSGIQVNTVKAVNGMVRAEDILAAIDDRTKVVAVSQVQYMSGYQTDLQKIGDYCHARGIILSVDGIQALGRNPIDVKKAHIGVYSCGGFKGLLGVLGAAFYYVDEALLPMLRPTCCSENNVIADEYEFPVQPHTEPLCYQTGIARLEGGSMNTYGILALGMGAELIREIGQERIHSHILELEAYLREELVRENIPVQLLGDTSPMRWSGMLCMNFDLEKADRLESVLAQHQIYATVRRVRGRGLLRISLHYPNSKPQLDCLVKALKTALCEDNNNTRTGTRE